VTVSIKWDVEQAELQVELCSPNRPQTIELELPFGSTEALTVELKPGEVKRIVNAAPAAVVEGQAWAT